MIYQFSFVRAFSTVSFDATLEKQHQQKYMTIMCMHTLCKAIKKYRAKRGNFNVISLQ